MSRNKGIFSLESNLDLQLDPDDVIAEHQLDDEFDTSLSEIYIRSDIINETSTCIEELEQYQDIINKLPVDLELPDSTAKAIEIAVESLRSRLGIHSKSIGLESRSNKRMALENVISDTIKSTWDAIVKVILRIIRFIKDFFNGKHYKRIKNFFKRFNTASSYINSEFGVKYLSISNKIIKYIKNKQEIIIVTNEIESLTEYTDKIKEFINLSIFPKYRNNVSDVLKLYSDLEDLSENNIISESEDILSMADKNEPIDEETKELIKKHNVYSMAAIKIISGLNILSKSDNNKVKIPVSKKGMLVLAHGLKVRFPKNHVIEIMGAERNPIAVDKNDDNFKQQVINDIYNKVVYTTKEKSCYTDSLLGMIGFIIRVKPDTWYSRDVGSTRENRINNTKPNVFNNNPSYITFLFDINELDLNNKSNSDVYNIAKSFHPDSKDVFTDGYTEFWSNASINDIIGVWYKKDTVIPYYDKDRVSRFNSEYTLTDSEPLGTCNSSSIAELLAKKLGVKAYQSSTGDTVYDIIVDNNILGSI